ncbi:MAG TPA: response regulator [Gemmatimonadales bacterium]|nr:response regulator [Gemmatimonadales bacterium]
MIVPVGDHHPPAADSHGGVLVVDDEPSNRELLRGLLEPHGYLVTEARDGLEALTVAAAAPPDVILLDVMMPALDGFEVCRRLKQDPRTIPVPVLIVSSLTARSERLEGIRAGASDFVTKPIDGADLLLRVRNAVAGKRLYDRMQEQYVRLRELETLRDSLVHMLVHDVRSPLGAIGSYLHLLGLEAVSAQAPEILEIVAAMKRLVRRMNDMVAMVLDVSRMDSERMPVETSPENVREVIAAAVETLSPELVPRIRIDAPAELLSVRLDRPLIERVLINLMGNALKFSPASTPVVVTVGPDPTGIRILVEDQGPGIPEQDQERVFEKFGQAQSGQRTRGFGLGLTFCRMAVEAHGGTIGVTSAPGSGATFWIVLPAPQANPSEAVVNL